MIFDDIWYMINDSLFIIYLIKYNYYINRVDNCFHETNINGQKSKYTFYFYVGTQN